MTDKDIKELMVACGWEWYELYDSGYSSYSWRISFEGATEAPFGATLPEDFIPDLNFLFKHAVPKLGLLQIILQPDSDEWYCGLTTDTDQQTELTETSGKDPADALAHAILEALRK